METFYGRQLLCKLRLLSTFAVIDLFCLGIKKLNLQAAFGPIKFNSAFHTSVNAFSKEQPVL